MNHKVFFACVIVFMILICLVLPLIMVNQQKAREQQSGEECRQQGGKVVQLDNREWCLINGQNLEF